MLHRPSRTLGFGHGVGVTISKREAQSGASKSTLLENLKNGKRAGRTLTDELEAKGCEENGEQLKRGETSTFRSKIEALTESDVSVYQVDDNFADNQMDADVKEVNNPFCDPKEKKKIKDAG